MEYICYLKESRFPPMKYRGATLATTLLILFIITLLAVSTIQVTQMQEKMTANLQDKEISFHAAESALAAGENWILNLQQEPVPVAVCSNFPCVQSLFGNMDFSTQNAGWWQSHSTTYSTALYNVSNSPHYLIEFLQYVPDTPIVGSLNSSGGVYYYQITARGTGSTTDSQTILQTTVARRF